VITGLAHVCFVVSDLEASIKFYTKVLGLTPAFNFTNEQGERFGIYLHVGGRTFVELFQGDLAARAEKQSYQHFCLEVDDFDKTVEELRSRGAEVTDVKLGMDRSWQAWLADPDGNRFELHGYTAESRQVPHLK
jgi:catechol 2,3-dioxygenase-like lactoylglutathione lyase family enzyme